MCECVCVLMCVFVCSCVYLCSCLILSKRVSFCARVFIYMFMLMSACVFVTQLFSLICILRDLIPGKNILVCLLVTKLLDL